MAESKQDQNYNKTILAVSNADNSTPINVWVDPTTHRLLVDSSGGGGSGGTSMVDDAAFTPGTTEITPMGAFFDDAAPDSVNEGDGGVVRMSGNRNLYVQLRDAAGNERGVNVTAGNALTVDASATTQPVSAASLPLPTGAATLAEQQTQTASLSVMDDWDETDRAKVNIVVGQAGVTAGAGAVAANTPRVTLASDDPAVVALQIMDDWDNAASDGASVSGDVAHDAADAGEPVKIGGKALTAQPTAVAANDRVNAMFDIYGRQVALGTLREMKGNQITTITSSTAETTVVTADATYKLDVYAVFVTNTSATATEVSFKDSTAGTTRFTLSVPANDMRGFCLPVDAGHLQGSANNNWTATCADSVASIIITVLFVKNL